MYPYGLIGNCQISALVSRSGSIDWLCMPQPDKPPIFGRMLDPEGGTLAVEVINIRNSSQAYVTSTNVLQTTIDDGNGVFTITDFCPRYEQHGRTFRPVSLFRIVSPVSGHPMIKIVCSPVGGWSKQPLFPQRGNSQLRYDIGSDYLRMATNMPLTYLLEGRDFVLRDNLYFGLSWNSAIEEDLEKAAREYLQRTIAYWQNWVRRCSIPAQFQKETIRSALALKLHSFEDTGAVLAALSTSLPEERESG